MLAIMYFAQQPYTNLHTSLTGNKLSRADWIHKYVSKTSSPSIYAIKTAYMALAFLASSYTSIITTARY